MTDQYVIYTWVFWHLYPQNPVQLFGIEISSEVFIQTNKFGGMLSRINRIVSETEILTISNLNASIEWLPKGISVVNNIFKYLE